MISLSRARGCLDRVADSAVHAFVWWVEGLRLGLPPRLQAAVFRPRERLVARLEGERILIRRVRESGGSSVDTDDTESEPSLSPGQHADLPEGADVILALPREARLTTELDVPRAAAHELRSLIHHELDRLTPFPITECAFDYHIRDEDSERSTLRVGVALTRRRELDALVRRAAEHGVAPTAVSVENDAGELLPIDLSNSKRRLPFRLATPRFEPLLAAIALVAVLAAAYLPLGRYADQLQAYEATVSDRREAAVSARGALDEARAAAAGARFLEHRRREYERPLDLLADLTREIPNDAWISRLSTTAGGIQLQGESGAASSVLEVVESLEELERAEFQAPVARSDTNGKERFSIAAAWVEND